MWEHLRGATGQVLFKPNLLHHRHALGGDHAAVVTQPPVLELAWNVADRLSLSGRRVVADAPQGDADFALILSQTHLDDWARNRGVSIVDLRRTRWDERRGVPTRRVDLPGDPAGAVRVNLGQHSAFSDADAVYGTESNSFYGADYNVGETNVHHQGGVHEYLFSGSALSSDIVVNVPKLKTHKKVGVTLSLKNLVGLNADKNWLPHYRFGSPREGGDAYPEPTLRRRFENRLLLWAKPRLARTELGASLVGAVKPAAAKILGETKNTIRSGNWWGNDTTWRMVLDLNRILRYARVDGSLADSPQRRTVSVIDGLIAGQGRGPEAPDRLDAELIIAGTDFVAVDIVAATVMGFDYRKIPHLLHALDPHPLPLTSVDVDALTVESNVPEWNRNLWEIDPKTLFEFRPHFGWKGHIEREAAEMPATQRA
jgi:uncharacterized protein (DUF362 family)